jgi:hypothetical protein
MRIKWGGLRRLEPISRKFGMDLGKAIDRYYIERFLETHQADIRGRVLEVGDATYTRQFGRTQVDHSDILLTPPGGPNATIVGDFVTGQGIPREAYDCIILTQVLPFIFDLHAAVATIYSALRPGGVVLATVGGISQISRYDMDRWGDYWRFTTLSCRRLFQTRFQQDQVKVKAFGNVLVATAFIQGMPLEELTKKELEHFDPDYEVLITIRAARRPAE